MDILSDIGVNVLSAIVAGFITFLIAVYTNKKNMNSMMRNEQLPLYQDLWGSLIDLKSIADNLWKDASKENLKNFIKQLGETETKINKNSIIIEKHNKQELDELVEVLWNFAIGKTNLIELRSSINEIDRLDNQMIRDTIKRNGEIKKRFDKIYKEMEKSFRKQLRKP